MSLHRALGLMLLGASTIGGSGGTPQPTSGEMAERDRWVEAHLKPDSSALPFAFVYGGVPFKEDKVNWKAQASSESPDPDRTRRVLTLTDARTGLVVRCEAVVYSDFPTVEWTLYLRNGGSSDTPVLENIQSLDMELENGADERCLLHHWAGSQANRSDYAPRETPLGSGSKTRLTAAGGRPTNTDLSYFNLERGGKGLIVVVGWPGQWAAEFSRNDKGAIRVVAGQELTHFVLRPGEEVRTPLMVLQFWEGDWVRSQNVWRRWMMNHSMPKPGGKLPPPQLLAGSSRAYEEMIGANEENQIMFIDRYLEEGLKLDYWWMDAGWYIQEKGWPQVGTWEVDPKRFPKGFKPICDHAHAKGVRTLVWFEPERVAADTWLSKTHPEWILGGTQGGLLNLGNQDAWNWLVEHVDKLLTEQGIDLYRQDFNMDPLQFWRNNDAEDRRGITENKHVTGYLAYWDELRRRHPDMLIDSCASGGRRNDLETMRRAVPLWRSDYAFEPIGHQCMTYGLSFWLPFHGTGTVACANATYYGGGYTPVEPYAFWSNACPSISCGFDMRVKELDYESLRRLFAQWRDVSKYYYGDYYPLTPYTQDEGAWIAWQFNVPQSGEGMVQVFRRAQSVYERARFPLKDLDPEARYVVKSVANPESAEEISGKDLLENGLLVSLPEKPGAAVVVYKKIQP